MTCKTSTNLQGDDDILYIESAILCQGLGDNQQSIRKRLHAHLNAAFGALFDRSAQMSCTCHFERACTWNESFVLQGVLNCTEAIPESVLYLGNSVGIWAFDK